MKTIGIVWGMSAFALLGQGCRAPEKVFEIKSFPPGALIYVEGQDRGQTDQKVAIKFYPKERVTVRVEKAGFQTQGADLDVYSPSPMTFFLQEAPRTNDVLKELREMKGSLSQISDLLGKYLAEKNK